ncbi:MAG: hypothetical protein J3T61_11050, partial [Candidatus Brocadiales bacterium]|nr:hypothetical protein [Candidatus Bathyanammoxibius sp.]
DVPHFSVATRLASKGVGVALVPYFSVAGEDLAAVSAVPFEPPIPISIGVLHPLYQPLSEPALHFSGMLKAVCVDICSTAGNIG